MTGQWLVLSEDQLTRSELKIIIIIMIIIILYNGLRFLPPGEAAGPWR